MPFRTCGAVDFRHFCTNSTQMSQQPTYTNALIHETSPYLLQHAHNPVNWVAWNSDIFQKAQNQQKLVIISVGYSTCHWCHVMEHESFEDEEVAALMNEYFICVKVDREEHADVDALYMDAVQLMTGRGGWPLNCVTLPDGRPIFGGTYFPKNQWITTLNQLQNLFANTPEKVLEYADNLEQGLKQNAIVSAPEDSELIQSSAIEYAVEKWKKQFDTKDGGPNRAPKFPMPAGLNFLMQYGSITNDVMVENQLQLTLNKMAWGGIYDQAGGGFARYSVDVEWKIPHFEKMLYDNGQLLSVYAQAYCQYKNLEYLKVIEQTITFLNRELQLEEGAYFSALDADSEGIEGKFYTWSNQDFDALNLPQAQLAKEFYGIGKHGYWSEEGVSVLMRTESLEAFATKNQLNLTEFSALVQHWETLILAARSQRIRPGLDDKYLTSWNALTLTGILDAYWATQNQSYLTIAINGAQFLVKNLLENEVELKRTYKNGIAKIDASLEDYSTVIQFFTKLFEATQNKYWLQQAEALTYYVLDYFSDSNSELFYTSKAQSNSVLLTRKTDIDDDVIPSSNAIMAHNLWILGTILGKQQWVEKSKKMLTYAQTKFKQYAAWYAHWGSLAVQFAYPFYELVLVGPKASELQQELKSRFVANTLVLASNTASDLPLFAHRFHPNKTLIYPCMQGACQLPVETIEDALTSIKY